MVINVDTLLLDAVPSIEDIRDYRYSQKKIELKESMDLLEWDGQVDNQSFIGSCVSNAIASAYELMVNRLYPDKAAALSRLFVYYNSRLFDNTIEEDTGSYIRDGLKAVARYGVCTEKLWPYDELKFKEQPSPQSYVDATQRLISKYEALHTLRDLLEVLNDDRPIVIGMSLYDGFMDMGPSTSVVRMPKEDEKAVGFHSVIIVGYDLPRQLFLAKNSFGNKWGDRGYFWIPFEYVRTQVFEKWCFEINNQSTIDIDLPITTVKPEPGSRRLAVETNATGFTLRQGNNVLYRKQRS